MKQGRVDTYVLETLMPDLVLHDHRPSAFLVYLQLSHRAGRRRVQVRHREMAEMTGLSQSAVQSAIRSLSQRRLFALLAHRRRPFLNTRPASLETMSAVKPLNKGACGARRVSVPVDADLARDNATGSRDQLR